MGTVRYVLRTDKPDKNGLCPVRLLYQMSGKVKYYKTREKLRPQHWNTKLQQAIYLDAKQAKKLLPSIPFKLLPTSGEIDDINHYLTGLRVLVKNIEKKFELNNELYSIEMIVGALNENQIKTTKTEAPTNQLFDFIDTYIEDNKASREPGSLSVYKALKGHLLAYQTEKKKKVTFEMMDYSFFQDFQNFLITPRNVYVPSKKKDTEGKWKLISLNNTTIAKQLSTIKTFLNYARLRGIKVDGNYSDFKIKKESLEVIALTNEEFETLLKLDLSGNKRLDQVRDVFCFSCSTGLRYSDLSQLKQEHIKRNEIRLTVTKTKKPLLIPLNRYSHDILSKYAGQHKPLPVISNQKTNEYIKELCKLAGILEPVEIVRFRGAKKEAIVYPKSDLISIHTGRKTFCTLSLEKGMSAEEVMQISGHKDYQSFKRYVKITEARTKVVMRNAWGEVRKNNLKIV